MNSDASFPVASVSSIVPSIVLSEDWNLRTKDRDGYLSGWLLPVAAAYIWLRKLTRTRPSYFRPLTIDLGLRHESSLLCRTPRYQWSIFTRQICLPSHFQISGRANVFSCTLPSFTASFSVRSCLQRITFERKKSCRYR